jgi:hypothetical protein
MDAWELFGEAVGKRGFSSANRAFDQMNETHYVFRVIDCRC